MWHPPCVFLMDKRIWPIFNVLSTTQVRCYMVLFLLGDNLPGVQLPILPTHLAPSHTRCQVSWVALHVTLSCVGVRLTKAYCGAGRSAHPTAVTQKNNNNITKAYCGAGRSAHPTVVKQKNNNHTTRRKWPLYKVHYMWRATSAPDLCRSFRFWVMTMFC